MFSCFWDANLFSLETSFSFHLQPFWERSYQSQLKYFIWLFFSAQTTRSREVNRDWEQGPSSQCQGEKNPEASNHLLQFAAAGPAPALPADPVPGSTRACRPGGQTGPHPDSGGPQIHPVPNPKWITRIRSSRFTHEVSRRKRRRLRRVITQLCGRTFQSIRQHIAFSVSLNITTILMFHTWINPSLSILGNIMTEGEWMLKRLKGNLLSAVLLRITALVEIKWEPNCCDLQLDPLMHGLFTVLNLMDVFPLSVLMLEDLSVIET